MALDDEIDRLATEKSALIERVRIRLEAIGRVMREDRKARLKDLPIPQLEQLAASVDGATTVPQAVTMVVNAISDFDARTRLEDDSKLNGKA